MIFGLKFYLEQPNLNFYNPIDATLDCGVSVIRIGKNLSNLKQMHKATIARSKNSWEVEILVYTLDYVSPLPTRVVLCIILCIILWEFLEELHKAKKRLIGYIIA